MGLRRIIVALGISVLGLAGSLPALGQDGRSLSSDQMKEDLNALYTSLLEQHPHLYRETPQGEWERGLAAALATVDKLDRAGFLGELRRLVGLTKDGHTGIARYPGMSFHPLRVEPFKEGYFVVAAAPELEQFVGGRIVAVGKVEISRALEGGREFFSVDNDEQYRHSFASSLRLAGIQHQLGFTPSGESETLTIEGRDGVKNTFSPTPEGYSGPTVRRLGALGVLPEGWVDACEVDEDTRPLWLTGNHKNYWFEHLEELNTVYFQYNVVGDAGRLPFSRFCSRVFSFIEREGIEKLILDLRHNGGGNGYLNQHLVHELIRSDSVRKPGQTFVITGGKTFSAAMMACLSIEKHTQALFVGEPTGALPNHAGDARLFSLPNSGVGVFCSTLAWGWIADPRDQRKWIAPDLPAPISFENYRTGKDPAWEKIFSKEVLQKRFAYVQPNNRWRRSSQRQASK